MTEKELRDAVDTVLATAQRNGPDSAAQFLFNHYDSPVEVIETLIDFAVKATQACTEAQDILHRQDEVLNQQGLYIRTLRLYCPN